MTYQRTASHNARAADPLRARKRRSKHRRDAQDSLLSLPTAAQAPQMGAAGVLPPAVFSSGVMTGKEEGLVFAEQFAYERLNPLARSLRPHIGRFLRCMQEAWCASLTSLTAQGRWIFLICDPR